MRPEWKDFVGGKWESEINVSDFIQKNFAPYEGDEAFLAGPTQNTTGFSLLLLKVKNHVP